MKAPRFVQIRFWNVILILSLLLPSMGIDIARPAEVAQAAAATHPVVAIHISELTQALETTPAVPPTPTGSGYSGFEWFYTSWHYFVMPESLKIALESDGTPYVVVTDADIAAGALMDGSAPRYPIVFSLATEVVDDSEIQPLRNYVNAGGFLFVGSSSFTRNTNGTTRGDFALATEMGLNMVNHNLLNWTTNASITHSTDHRLVSHIPTGTVNWDMQANAEDITWTGANPIPQQLWQTVATGAEVIATGSGYPLIATNGYGSGRFIYHAMLNPIVGVGSYDTGMYAYTIIRSAVEWAFQAANLPIIKRSPWPYAYDAAFIIRHDFENYLSYLNGTIETSAQYEQSVGAKGDYYFCTGILRTLATEAEKQPYIDSMRRAVTLYGATIGSHNGGLPNIGVSDPGAYDYWHWGPDTMFDRDPSVFPSPYTGTPTAGYDYSKESVRISFQDIEGWLAGTDNGRTGCGAVPGSCPHTWVAPYINSGRDRSYKILEELEASTAGEQKVSPFPHWTLSYDPANTDHRYDLINLPLSDWYVGATVSQSQDSGHTPATIQAMIDFYYQKGYLINLYGHGSSTGGNMNAYVTGALAKENIWATNAIGVYDWWVKRDTLVVTTSYSKVGGTSTASATIGGTSRDPEAAVELVLPNWSTGAVGDLVVRLNGVAANPSEFRTTDYGIKVRVGTSVTSVSVDYQPLEGWVQTDWVGGAGQAIWTDPTKYEISTTSINHTVAGQLSLNQTAGGTPLFSDNFDRTIPPPPDPVPFNWIIPQPTSGNWFVQNTIGGTLNTSLSASNHYAYAYKEKPDQPLGNYTIETDIRFPAGFTGGGGVFGRLAPSTGAQYAIWIYPSSGIMRLINYDIWNDYAWTPALAEVTNLPTVGTGWHHLKVVFSGSNIQVFYDNEVTPRINATNTLYSAGFVGVDFWDPSTYGPSYNNFKVTDNSGTPILFEDTFGEEYNPGIPPWTIFKGSWTLIDNTLRCTAGAGGGDVYADIYYTPTDPSSWTDYSVQAKVQYPTGSYGGLAGRWNPATGNRYTAWVYPATNELKLLDYSGQTSWTALATASIPAVGTGWHTTKMDFASNHIRVYWDGNLVIDHTDSATPFLTGGIGIDTAQASGAYVIAADDVEVIGPSQFEGSGTLTSSAFDGGVGAKYYNISWDASVPASTSLCVQTRTADRQDLLATEPWSECYLASGADVTSPDRRWIQYQVTLGTTNLNVSPVFYENGITYSPGSYLPQSFLTYNSPPSGDSQTTANLFATLREEDNDPIVGRTVSFTLDGLSPVSGVTNGSGVAAASLPLNIAPGAYPLAIAFASDGVYGPSSVSTTFDVTESWSEWIQDSDTDFGSGTGSCFDITPSGSVILDSQFFGEGEEPGSWSLGSQTWSYRHRIYIDNPNSVALPAGYSIKLVVNTAALVSAVPSKLLANGDDLRVVRVVEGTPVELDRVADTAFNSPATEIWFKTQAAIPADTRDSSYYIYYKNPTAGSPPANGASVFTLYDGFDDTMIDSTLWNQTGTAVESGGWARLSSGADLISKQTLTYGMLEMRIQALASGNYKWWGWEDGLGDAPNFIIFEDFGTPGFVALLRNDGGSYLPALTLSLPPSFVLTDPHTYGADWRSGSARFYVDGAQVQSASSGIPDSHMNINLYAYAQAFNIDWARVRLSAAQDPVVALATPYTGYVSECTFTSSAYDTGGTSYWKYLIWDAIRPVGTALTFRIRTADTQASLATAAWVDYLQTGLLVSNGAARWIQYEARLITTDSLATPELQKVTIYYSNAPTAVTVSSFTASSSMGTAQLDWETASEIGLLGFNLYRSETLDGAKQQLNAILIPAMHSGQLIGASYQFSDLVDQGKRYYYWLELVKTQGTELLDPVAVDSDYLIRLPLMIR